VEKEARMAEQIVMDHSGDSRFVFDPSDITALAKAEGRFNRLIGGGYTAAVRDANGTTKVTRIFDPKAEEALFFPRLVGG
jgi:hypothetical protein